MNNRQLTHHANQVRLRTLLLTIFWLRIYNPEHWLSSWVRVIRQLIRMPITQPHDVSKRRCYPPWSVRVFRFFKWSGIFFLFNLLGNSFFPRSCKVIWVYMSPYNTKIIIFMLSMRPAHRVVILYGLAACLRISRSMPSVYVWKCAYPPIRLLSIIFIHNNNALNDRV